MNHFGDDVIAFFKKAASKLEELQLQTALGKAELSDKLEEIKKETKDKINHIKWDVSSEIQKDKEIFNHFKAKLEHLELQLALGKAETEEHLTEQKKNISAAISDVKNLLAKD
jgi:formiminotetrahydrofolate cyclodeaminase